jgi:hypothetical protein
MLTNDSIRQAFIDAAIRGKELKPGQLMASLFGRMGGVFGKLQGPIGAMASQVRPPTAPTAPKPLSFSMPRELK